MKKTVFTFATLAVALATSACASARPGGQYAMVIDARPVYESARYEVPEQSCHYETVAYREPGGQQSYTGTIAGGIIGAAVGNKLGGNSRRNKDISAVAGGLLGASIGRDVSNNNRSSTTRYRDEQVCQTRYRTEYSQQITGYNVTYQYDGRVYQTHTRHHPGDRIPVDVQVRPVHGYR